MMEGVTCPNCQRILVGTFTAWEEGDDDDELLRCPWCLRSFDPCAEHNDRHGSHETAGLDELFDAGDRDDEEGDER